MVEWTAKRKEAAKTNIRDENEDRTKIKKNNKERT